VRTISLEEGKEKYGVEEKDGEETYKTIFGSKTAFTWDSATLIRADGDSSEGDFLATLDALLLQHGLEVVQIDFDGDCFPWTIEPKI